jgi:hypothetical protein
MKRVLMFAAVLTFCALSAKAQQPTQIVAQTTLGELDARAATAAAQATQIDQQCGLVYGFISPLAVIQNAQMEWMEERGCYKQPPSPPQPKVARNDWELDSKNPLIAINPRRAEH